MTDDMPDEMKAFLAVVRSMADGRPMWEIMREAEIKRGYVPVDPGAVSWFPAEDWGEHDLVTFDASRDEVRIVAIGARQRGKGAFTRLVIGIMAADFVPVVICPLATMQEILEGWGWQEMSIGSTFEDREDQWRPRSVRGALGEALLSKGTDIPAKASARAGGPATGQEDGK